MPAVYTGQTKRSILTRFKEHVGHIRNNKPEKSSVAEHILTSGHNIDTNNLTLTKNVTKLSELDTWESIQIYKNKLGNKILMNRDLGPNHSPLLRLIRHASGKQRYKYRSGSLR